MDVIALHHRATDSTAAVLDRVADELLDAPTPCARWTIRDIVEHMVTNSHNLLARLDKKSTVDDFAELSHTAVNAYDDPEILDRTFELAGFEVDGRTLLAVNFSDVLVHGWDIARAAGFDVDFDLDLIEAAHRVTARLPESVRGPDGAFDHARQTAEDASPRDRLIAFLGRDPEWARQPA